MIVKLKLLSAAVLSLFLVFACQSPHISRRVAAADTLAFSQQVDNNRRSFVNRRLQLPLQIIREKRVNGTISGNFVPLEQESAFCTANGFLYTIQNDLNSSHNKRIARGINGGLSRFGENLFIPVARGKFGLLRYNLFTAKTEAALDEPFLESAPLLKKDKIYFATQTGIIQCRDGKSLKKIWENEQPGGFVNNLALSKGTIFAVNAKGLALGMDARSGLVLWKTQTSPAVLATPVVTNHYLFIAGFDGALWQLDRLTGRLIKKISSSSALFTTPAADAEHIYTASANGLLRARNLNTLKEEWQFKTDGPVTITPLVLAEKIVVGSSRRHLYILDKKNGKLLQDLELEGRLSVQPLPIETGLLIGYEYRKLALLQTKPNNE